MDGGGTFLPTGATARINFLALISSIRSSLFIRLTEQLYPKCRKWFYARPAVFCLPLLSHVMAGMKTDHLYSDFIVYNFGNPFNLLIRKLLSLIPSNCGKLCIVTPSSRVCNQG
jgi:hypothetical protein